MLLNLSESEAFAGEASVLIYVIYVVVVVTGQLT